MPPAGCALGPPDDRLVTVATVFGFDIRSGVASFDLTVTSNEPSDPADIIITKSGDQARTLQLRLKRDRTYTIAATETDSAGNPVRATTTCTVPRKRGAAPPSTFTKIDFPGAIQTQLFSINNRGQIVGAYTDTNNVSHGFLLDNGTFTTLDVFPRGINDRGQMVGSYGGHGFILDHGVFTTFDFPSPHAVQTEGSAINNLGQITGRYWHRYNISGSGPAPSYPTPYLLDHGVGTSFIDKGFSDTVRVFGLNDRAQIVGEDTGRAFLLDNGTVTRLPGYSFSDINNRGQIVGTQAGVHPFLLDNGTFIMIDFPGTGTTQSPVFLPSGINDRGQIVGSLFASDNRNGQSYHGFLLSNNSSENGNGDDHGNNNKDHENNGNQK